jgi:uncharacterized protein (TIGR03437 family)
VVPQGSRITVFLVCAASVAIPTPVLASEADALAISQNIMARHFPYSSVLDPVFASPTSNQIVNYTRCGDSALWTGHFLAAEAFRYKVTLAADALDNARRAATGLQYLTDATGNNTLARCLIPDDSPYAQMIQSEESHNGIYHSAPGQFWVGNTSRDEYSGALFGLGVAYDLIDDTAMRSSITRTVSLLVEFLKDKAWNVILPDGTLVTTFLNRPDQQLAFLQLARHINSDQFSTAYDVERVLLSPTVSAPIAFDTLSDDSYFKFNLDTINLYTLVRLESSSFGSLYQDAYTILRRHTDDQGNAFFNMIDYALNGANATRDAETRQLLDQWLQRPRRDDWVDNTGKYPACSGQACNPIPVPDRVTTDFIWQRSPYQLTGGGGGTIETAGIDYILPYWMARYYGVIGPDGLHVSSAASGGVAEAVGGIVSIYGSNLAGATASAGAGTPPQSLGGVSVTVRDSAEVSWPAGMYYASPTQLNIVLPAGMAPGTAGLTIHSTGLADLTVSANVGNVAPALFSADGTGTGVAAAIGLRVTPAGQSSFNVFSCNGTTCTAIPINLGVDTPTYLSLYGTGIRNRSSLPNVSCTVGGVSVPVSYAGVQPQYAGLDQVNIGLTLSLRGKGDADVICTVDGVQSNAVRVNIQ